MSNLESELNTKGYPILNVRVAIDGTDVAPSSVTAPSDAPLTGTPNSTLEGMGPGAIAGIAGAGAFCVITALLVLRRQSHRRDRSDGMTAGKDVVVSSEDDDGDDSDGVDSPRPATSRWSRRRRTTAPPLQRTTTSSPTPVEEDELDAISIPNSDDDSLFISVDGRSASPPAERFYGYDLSGGLDRMLLSKDKTHDNDEEEAPPTPKQSNPRRK